MFKGFKLRRGLTSSAFAKQAGVAEERIEEWERQATQPTKADLLDIATAFNTSIFELLAPPPPSTDKEASPLIEWTRSMQRRWGALPHELWGYLQLQLGPDAIPTWYPVSGEQAANIDRQFANPGWSSMIIALTMNNRCVMFASTRVTTARLVAKAQALSKADFRPSWDAGGHPPEFYRELRAWAQKDKEACKGKSFDMASRIYDFRRQGTVYTRRKIISMIDHIIIHHVDDRVVRFSATGDSVRSAFRSVSLGSFTVSFDVYQSEQEYLAIVDDVRAIDMPSTDLETVSKVLVTSNDPPSIEYREAS